MTRTTTELTRNQAVVLEALSTGDTPLTAYEILGLERVRAEGLKAPPTIYRALEGLVGLGLVHRIESLNAYFACARGPHVEAVGFAICEHCRKVVELRLSDCEQHLAMSARKSGFRVDAVRVEMTGRCGNCRAGPEQR